MLTFTDGPHGLDVRAEVPLVLNAAYSAAYFQLRTDLRAGTCSPTDVARWVEARAREDALRRVETLPVGESYLFPLLMLDGWSDPVARMLRATRQRHLKCQVRGVFAHSALV